jgi:hypothetical protein
LRTEAIVFGRYLVDREPSEALIERYCRGNEMLLDGEDPIVRFAREHPWAVGMLDASAGLFDSGSLLRKKLLLMTAIVETTPELATRTEPVDAGLPRLALRLGLAGVRAAAHVVTGLALTAVVKRRA